MLIDMEPVVAGGLPALLVGGVRRGGALITGRPVVRRAGKEGLVRVQQ